MFYENALGEIDDLKISSQFLFYKQDINHAKLPEVNLSRTFLIASDRYKWRSTLDGFAFSVRISNRNLGHA